MEIFEVETYEDIAERLSFLREESMEYGQPLAVASFFSSERGRLVLQAKWTVFRGTFVFTPAGKEHSSPLGKISERIPEEISEQRCLEMLIDHIKFPNFFLAERPVIAVTDNT